MRRDEGVAEVGLPAAAGDPRGDVAAGGFAGWTRFTVDTEASDAGLDTVGADVRPFGSAIELDAGTELEVDGDVEVSAALTQGARTVPLRYPATPRWSGSSNLAIGTGEAAIRDAKAAGKAAILDPASGRLTGLAEGDVTVTATADSDTGDTAVSGSTTVRVVQPDTGEEEPPAENPEEAATAARRPAASGRPRAASSRRRPPTC